MFSGNYLLVSLTECFGRLTTGLNNERVIGRDSSAYVQSFTLQFLWNELGSVDEDVAIVVDESD